MPRLFTLANLILKCQRRADMENSRLISDSEWKALISEQYGDLFSTVADTGLQYFEYTFEIVTDGTDHYSEPTDHLGTISLDRIVDAAGRRRPLKEIMAQERWMWSGRTGGEAQVYAHVDDLIYLYPTPASGQTYEMLYIPQSPDIGEYADGDAVDLVTPDGEAFLVWGVAVKALSKSESDVRLAMAERDAARARLMEWSVNKAMLQPRRRQVDEFGVDSIPLSDGDWRFR